MKCRHVFALLLLLAFCQQGSAAALEIAYPHDGTSLRTSNYLVIKGGEDPTPTGFAIEINGVKSDIIDVSGEAYRAAFRDMLIVRPLFDPGKNRIIVEGYLGNEVIATAKAEVYYQGRFDKAPPGGYVPETFHLPEREEPCAECHNMTPTRAEMNNPDPRQNPCASCHMRMLNKAHVHGPAGVYECTYCHEADSRPGKYQARPGDASLCLECHQDKLEESKNSKHVHGPVDAGLCMVCHNPHASDHVAQLESGVNELCLSCHATVEGSRHAISAISSVGHPLEGPVNPIDERKAFNCSSCHNPHGGSSGRYFIAGVASSLQLCVKCHRK